MLIFELLYEHFHQDRSLLNARDYLGNAPIHYAARSGNVRGVQRLLELGADINAKDYGGASPLDYAIETCQRLVGADKPELVESLYDLFREEGSLTATRSRREVARIVHFNQLSASLDTHETDKENLLAIWKICFILEVISFLVRNGSQGSPPSDRDSGNRVSFPWVPIGRYETLEGIFQDRNRIVETNCQECEPRNSGHILDSQHGDISSLLPGRIWP